MERLRPNVLTIAGFDPSSGAGLTADIKTFEQLQCYGIAVQTANTIQTDTQFYECIWTDKNVVYQQLEVILKRFPIEVIKIGIMENWQIILDCISMIKQHQSSIKIILDPVLKSSTNFQFQNVDENRIDKILDQVDLLIPNSEEIKLLFKNKPLQKTINHIIKKTNLYLKGGHHLENIGTDTLFTIFGEKHIIHTNEASCKEKHGSGCVLSSAIAANLALGYSLINSCIKAKTYIDTFLSSNTSLLGYHKL